MKTRQLGNSDLQVSEICLGTMTYGQQNSIEEAHEQLDYAIAQGVNFIDTAEMYPVPGRAETQGRTSEYIGQWLAKQQRDQLIIATKVTGGGSMEWIRGKDRKVDSPQHRRGGKQQSQTPENRLHRPLSNPLARSLCPPFWPGTLQPRPRSAHGSHR